MPLQRWLVGQGVEFRFRTAVADMALGEAGDGWQVEALHLVQDGQPARLPLAADDRVFATLGAMATGATFGSMVEPAPLQSTPPADADGWALWRALAARRSDLGRPQAFEWRRRRIAMDLVHRDHRRPGVRRVAGAPARR